MPTAHTLLPALPSELLLQVLEALPITDCDSLRQAFDHPALQACYETRTSVREYLSRRTFDGEQLLKAIALSGVLIVGGLALDFFVPGSSKTGSRWVFLLPTDREKRYRFMKFMESHGVRWESALESLLSLQAENPGQDMMKTRFRMRIGQFLRAAAASDNADLRAQGASYEGISDTDWVRAQCWPRAGWVYGLSSQQLRSWNVARGGMLKNGIEQTVDLISPATNDQALHSYIKALPSTAAQCFISGFGAVHMYGNLAGWNLHHVWNGRSISQTSRDGRWMNDILWQDLREASCGAVPESSSSNALIRHSFDHEAFFVPVDNVLGLSEDDHRSAITTSCHLTWQHSSEGIVLQDVIAQSTQRAEGDARSGSAPMSLDMEDHLAEYGMD